MDYLENVGLFKKGDLRSAIGESKNIEALKILKEDITHWNLYEYLVLAGPDEIDDIESTQEKLQGWLNEIDLQINTIKYYDSDIYKTTEFVAKSFDYFINSIESIFASFAEQISNSGHVLANNNGLCLDKAGFTSEFGTLENQIYDKIITVSADESYWTNDNYEYSITTHAPADFQSRDVFSASY